MHPLSVVLQEEVLLLGGGVAARNDDGLVIPLSLYSEDAVESPYGSLWFSYDREGDREGAEARAAAALRDAAGHLAPHVAAGNWQVHEVHPPAAAEAMHTKGPL
jgi:hypothetical protein